MHHRQIDNSGRQQWYHQEQAHSLGKGDELLHPEYGNFTFYLTVNCGPLLAYDGSGDGGGSSSSSSSSSSSIIIIIKHVLIKVTLSCQTLQGHRTITN